MAIFTSGSPSNYCHTQRNGVVSSRLVHDGSFAANKLPPTAFSSFIGGQPFRIVWR
eukprot:m.13868 g.13868  ORF g.13868 m.13868 type:complete len:56 (+) comp4721_c0_seq1:142-309(+)